MEEHTALQEILEEKLKQEQKYGLSEHHPYKWLAILAEEVGEANKAVLESEFCTRNITQENRERIFCQILSEGKDCYRSELIQIAATALSMVESLDRKNNKFREFH